MNNRTARCANCNCEFTPDRQRRWRITRNVGNVFCSRKCQVAHHPRLLTITYAGVTRSVREWERWMHYPQRAIAWRLRHGWDPILAIVIRPRKRKAVACAS